jgi:diguanylate cyclase (GGDEF)-like protein
MRKIFLFSFLFYLSFFNNFLFSEVILLDQQTSSLKIMKSVKYFEDSNKTYRILDFLTNKNLLSNFKEINSDSISFGYTRSNIWLNFKLKNSSQHDLSFYIQNTYINNLDFYLVQNNKIVRTQKIGNLVPFEELKYLKNFKKPTIDFCLKPNEEIEIFAKAYSKESLILNLKSLKTEKVLENSLFDERFYNLILGIIIFLFIYNLFIYFIFNNKIQLFYIAYIFSTGIVLFAYINYFQFLISENSVISRSLILNFLNILTAYFGVKFTIRLISLEKTKLESYFNRIYLITSSIFVVLIFTDIFYANLMFVLNMIIVTIFLFILSIWVLINQIYFWFYSAGSILYWFSMLILGMSWFNLLEFKDIYLYILFASALIQLNIIGFAIFQKLKDIKNEKHQQEQELFELQKNYAQDLKKEVKIQTIKLLEANEKLTKISITDTLTGLYNRRKIHEILQYRLDLFNKNNQRFGVILFDVDKFKLINDTFGHDIGDEVLLKLSDILRETFFIHKNINYGRWGGEEFIIVVNASKKSELFEVAEKLRKKIENSKFSINRRVTCSFGGSLNFSSDINITLKRADKSLYEAKDNGRNCVKII